MKMQFEKQEFDVYLVDDGTLDTVLSVYNTLINKTEEYRFSEVDRNPDGTIADETFRYLAEEAIDAYLTDSEIC